MKYIDSVYTPNQSGKLGAVIFSRNQYGVYTCMRKPPVNPNTDAQKFTRAGTRNISREWAKLTDAQRENWRIAAHNYPFQKKGITYFLQGYVFFLKLNKNLYEVGEPVLKDFPLGAKIDPQIFDLFSVTLVDTPTGKDMLLFLEPAINSNSKLSLFATMPVKSSELYGTRRRYKIAVLDSSFVSGSSIKDLYYNKFGQLPWSATKAFFEYKVTSLVNGFSSNPIYCSTSGI